MSSEAVERAEAMRKPVEDAMRWIGGTAVMAPGSRRHSSALAGVLLGLEALLAEVARLEQERSEKAAEQLGRMRGEALDRIHHCRLCLEPYERCRCREGVRRRRGSEPPVAATLAEPEGSVEEAHHGATVEARVATPPGSASAAADEPTRSCTKPTRGIYGVQSRCARPLGHYGDCDSIWNWRDWKPAAADEPGETP